MIKKLKLLEWEIKICKVVCIDDDLVIWEIVKLILN